jgi:hypothetical protein
MAGSGQRARGQENGGQHIDDHSFWMGGKMEGHPLPMKTGTKKVESAMGGGSLHKYEDTNERIVETQREGVKKAKAHQGRLPEYRN